MPLLDHFHPPLRGRRQWTSFHAAWATFIASDLNRRLPEDFVAEGNARFGIEIDVATWADTVPSNGSSSDWQRPAPTLTLPFTATTDTVEVQVFQLPGGPILVGAIELVSPSNKDRDETREAFVSKCANCLQEGVGLIVIDIVTERKANLHGQLLSRVGATAPPWDVDLFAVSYHAIQDELIHQTNQSSKERQKSLQIWAYELEIGGRLPVVPFCLKGGLSLPLDLEATYARTCQESRISANGQ
jgi:hypothetical protein